MTERRADHLVGVERVHAAPRGPDRSAVAAERERAAVEHGRERGNLPHDVAVAELVQLAPGPIAGIRPQSLLQKVDRLAQSQSHRVIALLTSAEVEPM
jgi:hypothetical protein